MIPIISYSVLYNFKKYHYEYTVFHVIGYNQSTITIMYRTLKTKKYVEHIKLSKCYDYDRYLKIYKLLYI